MRLAISNIAWPAGGDEMIAPVLLDAGAEGVEVAPTKVWPRPLEASGREVSAYRGWWESRGLPIVALQSLLFGRPDLQLFGAGPNRREMVSYLKGMIDLAGALGARALVFGSPRNRLAGARPAAEVEAIAVAFFRELGDHAGARNLSFCVEANPAAYGCDFATTTAEACDLVRRVGSAGFGLHIDTGGMALSAEGPETTLARLGPDWRHFHVSEPHLAPVGGTGVDHHGFARALKRREYGGWISIEMKDTTPDRPAVDSVRAALTFTRDAYLRELARVGTPKN